jgi:uncharacterized protein (TIGR03437 family)
METSTSTQAPRATDSGTRLWWSCAACLVVLSGSATLLALIVRRFGELPAFGTAGSRLLNTDGRETWEAIAVVAGLALALAAPRFGRKTFGRLEQHFSRIAANRTLAIFGAGLFPVILRLSLLPAIPIPQPHVADEFGYLLLADTFASGRITNPTHPMWRHFESLYVFHQPTYSSQYPIAQGLMMAVPMAVGARPWFGILMSAGLMCAALCWMLQGWMPTKWALLGALVAGVRFDVVTSWMNSYWGGATPAIGGALLMGALPRLLRGARIRDALLAGAGLAILSQSRPFEGILLSLPVGALLLARLLGRAKDRVRALAPLAVVSVALTAGGLYYNWRVTGHALLLPYQLHQRIYGTPQNLLWSGSVATASRVAEFKDIRDNFEWQLGLFQDQSTWSGLGNALQAKSRSFWDFYLQTVLSVPLLLLPVVLRRDNMRFLFSTCLFVLLAEFLLYPFFYPHYTALLCGPILVLVLQGARYLRTIRWRGARVGDAVFRWCAVTGVISSVLLVAGAVLSPVFIAQAATPRSRIEEELERRGGKHLVMVRYTPHHSIHEPWIYNAADVDRSPVIWARELDETSMPPLLRYYADRQVWLVNADAQYPKLIPYEERNNPQISAMHNAAGKSVFIEKGVSPGSLVTLFGMNLGNPDPARAEGCLVSGIENGGSGQPEVKLPGLDGSRPGVPVWGRREKLPRLAIGQSALYWGATFVLTGGPSKVAPSFAPDPKRLSVRFGDLPAQVLCVQQSGEEEAATVLVPLQLHGQFVDVIVRSGEHETVEDRVPVLPANPGIFQLFTAGKRAAALLRPDGSWVSSWNRARRGETLRMFVTGIGPFTDAGPESPLIVGVNDRGANLEFVNCGECSIGIAELGFQVPQETPAGNQISLSAAVVVAGKPVYSNTSVLAVQ